LAAAFLGLGDLGAFGAAGAFSFLGAAAFLAAGAFAAFLAALAGLAGASAAAAGAAGSAATSATLVSSAILDLRESCERTEEREREVFTVNELGECMIHCGAGRGAIPSGGGR